MNKMTNKPKVAILMATYNGEKFLEHQIISILDQQDVNFTLYISDDGSIDGTMELINSYKAKHPGTIKILDQTVRTRGAANNFYYLIEMVNSDDYDFIALSDQDDIWPSHKMSRAVDQLIYSNVDGYSSDFIYFDEHGNTNYFKKSYKQTKLDYYFETPGPGCSFVITKQLFEHIKVKLKINPCLKEFKYHDWLIYALARSANYEWKIDDSPNLFYRQHLTNLVGANQGFRAIFRRINRIFFGQWYREIRQLISLVDETEFKNKSNSYIYWFFVFRFFESRRNPLHSAFMIPFLLFIGIQKK